MSLLLNPLSPTDRIERLAVRPGLDSCRSVSSVGRFDGRTRVVAIRDGNGWHRGAREPWTASSAQLLRDGTATEVLLRRGFRRARVMLAWLPKRTACA